MEMFDSYKVIRSNRKTISVEVGPRGVLVRAPRKASFSVIDKFVLDHEDWIVKQLKKREEQLKRAENADKLTVEELNELARKAKELIPGRVEYYASKLGVTYGRITIRNQKTRWGSCSSKGNLNFNCMLMLAPTEVLDGVIVHELCHRIEMNHSKAFYDNVYKVYPDYKKWDKWLKNNGSVLLARMP